jgi:hypothetical protein
MQHMQAGEAFRWCAAVKRWPVAAAAMVGERATVGMITSEPPLRCSVTASCGNSPRP